MRWLENTLRRSPRQALRRYTGAFRATESKIMKRLVCLGAILTLLLNESLLSGAVLLVAYSLGLGVPFLVLASGLGGARRVARWLAAHIRVVNLAGGTLVIAMGLVLASGQFARLPQLFNFLPLLG